MLGYNINLTLEGLKTLLQVGVDIGVIWFLIYYLLKIIRVNDRTAQIFKGVFVVIVINMLAKLFNLTTLTWLTNLVVSWGILAIIIVFQPEIRTMLERVGKSNIFNRLSSLSGNEKVKIVDVIVNATALLSQNQIGALITIEQSQSLYEYIEKAIQLNSDISAELLTSLFVTSTPLHDGAVIIQGEKIACAGAYFPSTTSDLPNKYGARHRAAVGISEVSDAVSIIVSEETGGISITENGKIYVVNRAQLKDYLLRVICGSETQTNILPTNTSQPEQKESKSGKSLLDTLMIRRHEEKPRKIKSKKNKDIAKTEVKAEETSFSDENKAISNIKLPHHKVEKVVGYETLNQNKTKTNKSVPIKNTAKNDNSEKKVEVKNDTNITNVNSNNSYHINTSIKPNSGYTPYSAKIEQVGHVTSINNLANVAPVVTGGNKVTSINNLANVNPNKNDNDIKVSKEEKVVEKPVVKKESVTKVEQTASVEKPANNVDMASEIDKLLEKTSSINVKSLIKDSSVSSQFDAISKATLSNNDKGGK